MCSPELDFSLFCDILGEFKGTAMPTNGMLAQLASAIIHIRGGTLAQLENICVAKFSCYKFLC